MAFHMKSLLGEANVGRATLLRSSSASLLVVTGMGASSSKRSKRRRGQTEPVRFASLHVHDCSRCRMPLLRLRFVCSIERRTGNKMSSPLIAASCLDKGTYRVDPQHCPYLEEEEPPTTLTWFSALPHTCPLPPKTSNICVLRSQGLVCLERLSSVNGHLDQIFLHRTVVTTSLPGSEQGRAGDVEANFLEFLGAFIETVASQEAVFKRV